MNNNKRKAKKKGHFYCKCGNRKKTGTQLCKACRRKGSRKVVEARKEERRKKDRERKRKKRMEKGAVLVTHNNGINLEVL
jgi:hypothetical protein